MTNDADDARYEEIILGLICCEEAPQVVPACILCSVGWPWPSAELQKRADRADQSVLFFLAGANFWEKHAKNTRKQAKNRRFFGANFLGGEIGRC